MSFIVWGLGHGSLLFIERMWGNKISGLIRDGIVQNILAHGYTMICVVILWVFFRLGIRDSVEFITNLFRINTAAVPDNPELRMLVDTRFYILFIIGVLFSFPWWERAAALVRNRPVYQAIRIARYGLLLCLFVLSMCSLANNAYNPFIYFRF
jgi:alginate O-acetyltransferase complex protein AlgI